MAKQTLSQLKAWFSKSLYPTQTQFWDWMDSFFHKDEAIPMTSVDGLAAAINDKAETSTVQTISQNVSSVTQRVENLEENTRETVLLNKNVATAQLSANNVDKMYLLDVESFDYAYGTVLVQRLNRTTDGLADLQMVAQKRDSSYVLNTAFLHTATDQFNILVGAENLNMLIGDDPYTTGAMSESLLLAVQSHDIPSIWLLIANYEYNNIGRIHADVNANYTAYNYLTDFPYMMNRTETIIHLNNLRAAGKLPNGNVSVPLTDRFVSDSTNSYKDSYAFFDKYFYDSENNTYKYNYTIGCKMGFSFYFESYSTIVFCQKAKNIPVNIPINLALDGKSFSSAEKIRLLTKPYAPSYLVFTSSDEDVEFRPISGIYQEVTKGAVSLMLPAAASSCIDLELLPYYYDNTDGKTITVSKVSALEPLSSNAVLDDEGIKVDSLLTIYSSI